MCCPLQILMSYQQSSHWILTWDFFEVSKQKLLYAIKNNNKLLLVQYYTFGWYIEHWLKHVMHQNDESNSFLAHHIIIIQHWYHLNIKCHRHF
jgi:hypothetical protein